MHHRMRRAVAGAGAFSPLDISNLHTWLDAGQITGKSDGDVLGEWLDVSGNGHNFTAGGSPTYETNEFNGGAVINLDGVNEYFFSDEVKSTWNFLHNGNGFTSFIVFRTTDENPDVNMGLLDTSNSATTGMGQFFDDRSAESREDRLAAIVVRESSLIVLVDSTFDNALLTQAVNITSVRWGYNIDGDDYESRNNGVQLTSQGTAIAPTSGDATNTLHIGAFSAPRRYLKGDVAEVIIYDDIVSGGDMALIESYLATKYGVTI